MLHILDEIHQAQFMSEAAWNGSDRNAGSVPP